MATGKRAYEIFCREMGSGPAWRSVNDMHRESWAAVERELAKPAAKSAGEAARVGFYSSLKTPPLWDNEDMSDEAKAAWEAAADAAIAFAGAGS